MNKCKVVVLILCYIIVMLLVHIAVPSSMETSVVSKVEDKIIVGDKIIEKKQLERLLNTIASTPKTKAFAKRFGVEVEQAPSYMMENNTPKHQKDITYDVNPLPMEKQKTEAMNYLLQKMMEEVEEFFRKDRSFAHEALETYLKNKHNAEFWAKIEKFVKEN